MLIVGLGLSALLAWQQQRAITQQRQAQFERLATGAADQLRSSVLGYERGLWGLRGAIVALGPQRLDRSAFQAYSQTRDLDREFPGTRGLGYIQRVPPGEVDAFTQAIRARGWPAFEIRQLAAHADERWVIVDVAPGARNSGAMGLDIASEPRRPGVACAAAAVDKAAASPVATIENTFGTGLSTRRRRRRVDNRHAPIPR